MILRAIKLPTNNVEYTLDTILIIIEKLTGVGRNNILFSMFRIGPEWAYPMHLRMSYTLRHEKWNILLPVLCLCNPKSD